jgi:glycolate oxidase
VISDVSRRYDLRIGNVFHAGDGNLHPIILYDEREPDQVIRAIDAGREILKACIEMGGSLTGEHGIGVEKLAEMPLMFSPGDIHVMTELRQSSILWTARIPARLFPHPARAWKSQCRGARCRSRRAGSRVS